MTKSNRYKAIILHIFDEKYKGGMTSFDFKRDELISAAEELGVDVPKNLGDAIYALRYRTDFPSEILATQPAGKEWVILGKGRARYEFALVPINRIIPNPALIPIKIPNATPELVSQHSLSDEQALLALVRYNRLIDLFFGFVGYSLQNHLRTTVKGIGQIEIDELYAGVDHNGAQYIIPVQAKGGTDQISVVQASQDIACCEEKFPSLICRAVSAQFMSENTVAIFELDLNDGMVGIVKEKHYRLVRADSISADELARYHAQ